MHTLGTPDAQQPKDHRPTLTVDQSSLASEGTGRLSAVSLLVGLPPVLSMGVELEPWLRPLHLDSFNQDADIPAGATASVHAQQ